MWKAGYLAASRLIPLAAPGVLRRRLERGKEDRARWREKLGEPGAPRPAGRVIWLHAVGIGEVMALRGLVGAMAARDPGMSFLVTSTARSAAQVLAANLPPRTQHQFLPLDAPSYLARFLDHWRPALSVWAEQDLWPGAVFAAAARGVPRALVNARLDARGLRQRRRVAGLYRAVLDCFALVCAQDAASAANLGLLGARDVGVMPSLKSAAPPLTCDAGELARLRAELGARRVWAAVSTHAGDEAVALAAHAALMQRDRDACLILAPRVPARAPEVGAAVQTLGLPLRQRSAGQVPGAGVYLADTFGEMGLWYRLAPVALVGGGFGIGGHNPWEAAALSCAVLHGPGTAHFAADYAAFHAAAAARMVDGADALRMALDAPNLSAMAARGHALWLAGQGAADTLAERLLGLAA